MTTSVRRGYVYPEVVSLLVWECSECGIVFGVPKEWAASKESVGGTVVCPNGDHLRYRESDADREKKRAVAAERRAENAENAARYQRERAEREQRRASAYRGQATRIRNRIVAGICPVPGCRRSGFARVKAHIASKHPTWAAEHTHEIGA